MQKPQFLISGLIGLALYLITTGLSFAFFSYFVKLPSGGVISPTGTGKEGQARFVIDPSVPRTEPCPLNGKLYTKQEREVWEKRRPLAVMIENHADSRPQSGVSLADVIYEAVAEGGISRFMGIFYCGITVQPVNLAPVRSARTYFLPWVLEYDALYNHVGGAGLCNDDTVDSRAKALCQIEQYKIKDMDQFGLPFKTTDKKDMVCARNYDRLDHEVATEHTMVCNTNGLYKVAAERGWTNVDTKGVAWDKKFEAWKFKDDAKEAERGASFSASFVAWPGYEAEYGVRWDYDRLANAYKRSNGGKPQLDLETQEQLTAKNIVIIFAKEIGPVDDHLHLLYNNVGSGNGLVFQDGKAIKITWSKPERSSKLKFLDPGGREVSLNRGQIWIEMLPIGTKVNY